MDQSFEVGKTVRLKSGGSLMTIISVGRGMKVEGQAARCAWIDTKGQPHEQEFPLSALELDDGTPPTPLFA